MFTIANHNLPRPVSLCRNQHHGHRRGSRRGSRRTARGSSLRFAAAALAAAPLMAAGLALPAPASADPPPAEITKTFEYTSSEQTFTVPAGVAYLDLTLDGGSGSDTGHWTGDGANYALTDGGVGGEVTGTLEVKPGDKLNFFVGKSGYSFCALKQNCTEHTGPLQGGRGGGYNPGGDGGGATSVYLNVPTGAGSPVAVAGGGGGAGGFGYGTNMKGGAGGVGTGNGDNSANGGNGTTASDPGASVGGAGGAGGGGDPIDGINNFCTDDCAYTLKGGGGGGGGGGYPKSGTGGSTAGQASGGGGGGGGDSYTGELLFGGIKPSPRVDSNGQLTITYKAPIDEAWASANPSTSSQGQPVTYSAKVHDYAGVSTPTGTVTFWAKPCKVGDSGCGPVSPPFGTGTIWAGFVNLCTATLKPDGETYAAGSGSCTVPSLPVGTYTVWASYSGDDTFPANFQTTFTETVSAAPLGTTTAVTASPPTSFEGDQVKYRATVHPASGTATPTGTVRFTLGSTQLCNNPISLDATGQAECKSPKAPLGSGTVSATYSGAPGFAGSTGTTTETVSPRAVALATTTSVTADPPRSTQGSPVTYTATVHPPAGKITPIGTVTFTAGPKGTKLCTATIPLNGVGKAKCVSPRAPVGTDTVTATYQPADASFTGSSGTTTETVTPSQTAPSSQH